MFIPNDYKNLIEVKKNKSYRMAFLEIIEYALTKFIEDKNMFELSDFSYIYCDEYVLKTNCHKDLFSTLYILIDQPFNYKPELLRKKNKSKKNKITMPELYNPLDKIKEELYQIFVNYLDSNCLLWQSNNTISIRTAIPDTNDNEAFYINIIPTIAHYNDNNNIGFMYEKNGEIEIEYPDLLVKNFNKKNKQTKDKYRQTIVIFKNILLRDEKINSLPSEIIETILYNVPNSLFEDDSQSSLIKIINFIRNNNLQDFLTIDEQDKAFTSRYRSMSSFYVKHILKIIENYLSKI